MASKSGGATATSSTPKPPAAAPASTSMPPPATPGAKAPKKPDKTGSKESKSQPAAKKPKLMHEVHHIGPVANLEEMEVKVLKFQNRKLTEKVEELNEREERHRKEIAQLKERSSQTDTEIFLINRYTKSLDEHAKTLLKRFETDDTAENESSEHPSSPVTAFVSILSTLDVDEQGKQLSGRAQDMQNLVAKLVQMYENVSNQSRSTLEKIKNGESMEDDTKLYIDQLVKKNELLEKEALKTQKLYHEAMLKSSRVNDRISQLETERDEQKNRAVDLEWERDEEASKRSKTEMKLKEMTKLYTELAATPAVAAIADAPNGSAVVVPVVPQANVTEMESELEDQKALAASRLQEIEKLRAEKVDLAVKVDELKIQVQSPPDELITGSAKYKSLQTYLTVLDMEYKKLQGYYRVAKDAVTTLRNSYLEQLKEAQRHEEDGSQTLQTFLSNLQTATNAARRDYNTLRIDYEQEHASRENSGTNKDYDKLFKSVMQHNSSLQTEVSRLKKRVYTLQAELTKYQPKDHRGHTQLKPGSQPGISSDKRGISPEKADVNAKRDSTGSTGEAGTSLPRQNSQTSLQGEPSSESPEMTRGDIKEMKKQLRDKTKEYDELKLLYDMTKQANKSSRELVDVMASEKKLKEENAELKKNLAATEAKLQSTETELRSTTSELESSKARMKELDDKVHELEREYEKAKSERQRTGPDEELYKKVKFLEENWSLSKKALERKAAEEEGLMNEMEVTGQALEDMQNQNKQLIDQLKEKDNTNLKWMTDNIRNNHIIKALRDEKQAQEVRYQTTLQCLEKYEYQLRLGGESLRCVEETNRVLEEDRRRCEENMELWKSKALDRTKEANDLKLKLGQLEKELESVKTMHADKLRAKEADAGRNKRLVEENTELKRKLDRAKLIENAGSSDTILQEEIREYHQLLNCQSCKAARKDTVLTSCYHVFCHSCISKRYELRERRCPSCSVSFSANQIHRLYLGT
ncbi:hypothetical protein RvY_14288 [Ramazzottius varieornatus]|uniref:E3 ubiquitin protein ligase n=1 Tax=Ramazzottius varieornatus TaxID=947166 RepID=A0A1D1VY22_RAMVA|nr:hypothetical protein RvY_14288 [Ramazzottius varieornatus]